MLLYRNREDLVQINRDENEKVLQFEDLWKAYPTDRYYYAVVEYVRRVVLAGVIVFIFPNTAAQIASTFLLALLVAFSLEVLNPYSKWQDRWLSRLAHNVVLLDMYFALLLKLDVSDEASSDQYISRWCPSRRMS